MITTQTGGWQTIANYAKAKGCSRQYVYQLIAREEKLARSTDIDVLIVDGVKFVRTRTH